MHPTADTQVVIYLYRCVAAGDARVRLLSLMGLLKSKLPLIIPALYLLAVIACILLAFDFKGDINLDWTLVLIGLTLPWSIVSIIFMWALIHGAGLGFFTVMYLAFAGINALILYYVCSAIRRRYEEKTAT
jgi:hypothetical protein